MELQSNLALPHGFTIVPKHGGLVIKAPSKTAAQDYAEEQICRLRKVILNIDRPVEISWGGAQSLRITPEMVRRSVSGSEPEQPARKSSKKPPAQKLRGIIQAATDLDWSEIVGGSNPVYVSQLQDQHNLFLNQAAVSAQSGKPPAEFLSATAHALNFEEELITRCGHLIRDEHLREYNYRALRWFRDESGIWIRRHMAFVSNFWKISYLGQPCWLGEVLEAMPLETHLDNS